MPSSLAEAKLAEAKRCPSGLKARRWIRRPWTANRCTEQHSVERGFAFLKDPVFLASSDFVKKPERVVAPSLVMALCLLVYRLAEDRLGEQLAATGQAVPNQLKHPADRPTMRWMFRCVEGIPCHLVEGG